MRQRRLVAPVRREASLHRWWQAAVLEGAVLDGAVMTGTIMRDANLGSSRLFSAAASPARASSPAIPRYFSPSPSLQSAGAAALGLRSDSPAGLGIGYLPGSPGGASRTGGGFGYAGGLGPEAAVGPGGDVTPLRVFRQGRADLKLYCEIHC